MILQLQKLNFFNLCKSSLHSAAKDFLNFRFGRGPLWSLHDALITFLYNGERAFRCQAGNIRKIAKKMFVGVSRRFPVPASTVRHIVYISKVFHIPFLVSTL